MRNLLSRSQALGIGVILVLSLTLSTAARGAEKTIFSFKGTTGPNATGRLPVGNLISDAAGNLYGVTEQGGSGHCPPIGCGTVYELSPTSGGGVKFTELHKFLGSIDNDGAQPASGLIMDKSGNLYGTTTLGGNLKGTCEPNGCGTVFELSPASGGGWNYTILHLFQQNIDGSFPNGLVLDAAGNLYGTTTVGVGENSSGTVFELSSNSSGQWTNTVLYQFTGVGDGGNPAGSLVFDAAGNLYGTTYHGGVRPEYLGVVFELSPNSSGGWTESVLHAFTGTDGAYPEAELAIDGTGTLYGTTSQGGPNGMNGYGVVFSVSPNSSGGWTETVLHSFDNLDGSTPMSGVILDTAGNLYGTTLSGGKTDYGTVYQLSLQSNGHWAETVLHSFTGNGGQGPRGDVIIGPQGNLLGTTSGGGSNGGGGLVFEITP